MALCTEYKPYPVVRTLPMKQIAKNTLLRHRLLTHFISFLEAILKRYLMRPGLLMVARGAGRRVGLASTPIVRRFAVVRPMVAAPLWSASRLCSSASKGATGSCSGVDEEEGTTKGTSHPVSEFPIVQLPARSLLSRQTPLNITSLKQGEYDDLIDQLLASRKHYQYPSLSAPQIGWNVRVFVMFDGSVWVNPKILEVNCAMPTDGAEVEPGVLSASTEESGGVGAGSEPYRAVRRQPAENCWAWEPCASCAFLMHYIERPGTCRVRGYNRNGEEVERVVDGMLARFIQHEMDHMDGVLFTRRIPNTSHVVLADGFSTMSDWCDDYPSLEARSTFLYTTFTPPYTFLTESVHDAYVLDRKFEDGIYPGHEMDRQLRVENLAFEELQRMQWQDVKQKMQEGMHGTTPDDDATSPDAAEDTQK